MALFENGANRGRKFLSPQFWAASKRRYGRENPYSAHSNTLSLSFRTVVEFVPLLYPGMTKQFLKGMALSGAMFGMLCGVPAMAQNSVPPDNTKMNKGDASKGAVTADQAKNNKSDREIMAEIRKSIVNDKQLSTYAHNVKIIAQHGQVTLKGPVHSDDERKAIEAKAADVAGADHITNQITVKQEQPSK